MKLLHSLNRTLIREPPDLVLGVDGDDVVEVAVVHALDSRDQRPDGAGDVPGNPEGVEDEQKAVQKDGERDDGDVMLRGSSASYTGSGARTSWTDCGFDPDQHVILFCMRRTTENESCPSKRAGTSTGSTRPFSLFQSTSEPSPSSRIWMGSFRGLRIFSNSTLMH